MSYNYNRMDNKKNMPWWVIILIILGSLIGLIFLIAFGKVIIGTIKSLNYMLWMEWLLRKC